MDSYMTRRGEVREIIYPDDDRSISKKRLEYRVAVQHRDPFTNAASSRDYQCSVADMLGGNADHLTWTYRVDPEGGDEAGLGLGSKVLVSCIDGSDAEAIIVGGTPDDALEAEDVEKLGEKLRDRGHHLVWVFNGIRIAVTKDGALILRRQGATDEKGKVKDSAAKEGSTLTMFKDGSILLGTFADRDDSPDASDVELRTWMDQAKKKIELVAKEGVHLGDADNKILLGTEYRNKEEQLHTQLRAQLNTLTGQCAAISALLQTGSALHIVPVAGPVVAAPIFQQAASMTAANNTVTPQQTASDGRLASGSGPLSVYWAT